jgi:hypothetical protein
VIELLLFLGTFGLFFFLPVKFVIAYTNENWQGRVTVELSFLNGLLKRKRVIQILNPIATGIKTETVDEGRWFWIQKRTSQKKVASLQGKTNGFQVFLDRYRHFGVGITLLSYFLPARYHQWLLVAENLEQRGEFQQLSWVTQVGTGDAALTAAGAGLLWGVKEVLIGHLKSRYVFTQPPEINVFSNFQSVRWNMAFNCIFRVKLGYIMIAALMVRFRHTWRKGGVGNG